MNTKTVVGITAEYNPFHTGHAYQLTCIKKELGDVPIVAIMSSSFVQRGESAIADKWRRAAWAVRCDVDLVLELPCVFSLQSAQGFARGAVASLEATGIVTHLCFGCETNDFAALKKIAASEINSEVLSRNLASGLSYAAAMSKTLSTTPGLDVKLLREPNNILAIEYLKALRTTTIKELPLQRCGAHYNSNSLAETFPSAMAIRTALKTQSMLPQLEKMLPPTVYDDLLSNNNPIYNTDNTAALLLQYKLSQLSTDEIIEFCQATEGIENKIKAASCSTVFTELVTKIKSKRYPTTRIQRLLMQLLISTTATPFTAAALCAPAYLRVLAFNDCGRRLLKSMQTQAKLPVLTKIGKNLLQKHPEEAFHAIWQTEINAGNLYDILHQNTPGNRDYIVSPIYIKTTHASAAK